MKTEQLKYGAYLFLSKDNCIEWIYPGTEEMYQKENKQSIEAEVSVCTEFWSLCETFCVSDCCGTEAYCFYEDVVIGAAQKCGPSNVLSMLELLKSKVKSSSDSLFVSTTLNQIFMKGDLVNLIDHLEQIISREV